MKFGPAEIVKLEDIPEELITELNKEYDTVTFNLNEDIDKDTQSIISEIKIQQSEEPTDGVIVDPDTYQPILAKGFEQMRYMYRVNITGNDVEVRRVIEHSIFESTEIIGPMEPA